MLTLQLNSFDPSPIIKLKTRYDFQERNTVITEFDSIDWEPVWEADSLESLNMWTVLAETLDEAGYDLDPTDDDYDERIDKLREQFNEYLGATNLAESWKARQAKLDEEAARYTQRMFKGVRTYLLEQNPSDFNMDVWYREAVDLMGTDLKIAATRFVETLDKQD